jgi:peptide/nickel transport system substrate-binding protein
MVSTPEPEYSQGTLTLMLNDFGAERFDTHLTTGGVEYLRAVHGLLIAEDALDGTLKLGPGIATNWEISSDFLTWHLTIREGVRFHDGTDLTVDDVVWSLQHGIGPGAFEYVTGNSSITLSRSMERIEKTGPNEVSLTTMNPSVEIPSRISEGTRGGLIGAMMPRRDTFHNLDDELAYDENPIGAGPMSFVEHVPAESMTLERFADFYYQPENGFLEDKRMQFKELNLRLVPEEATRVAALRTGDGDIGLISLDTKDQVESGGGQAVFGPEGVAISVRFIGCWDPGNAPATINEIEIPQENYPCIDRRVRQALAYALPKEAIQNNLYGGPEVWEIKGWTRVTPSAIGYSPELDPFPYDPDKARQLLAEAGYPGGEGFPPLVINTWPNNAVPFLVETALQGASSWEQELGLDVEVKVSEGSISSKILFGSTDFFGQIVWRDDRPRLDPASLLKSRYGTRESFSQTHQDPELYALSKQGLAAFDPATREVVLRDIYRRLRDEAHFISFGYLNIPWGAGSRIQSWNPNPLSNFPSALHTIKLAE